METTARRPGPDWRPWRVLALLGLVPVLGLVAAGTLAPPAIAETACTLLLRLVGHLPGGGWPTTYSGVQSMANGVMFVPVGALLVLGSRPPRWPMAALAGPAASLGVETAQRWIPGRVPDGFDLLTNSAGSVLGCLIGGAVVGVLAVGSALARLTRPVVRAPQPVR
jgi:VanZ family protein